MKYPERIPEDQILVIFGATGDLARYKLVPALFDLDAHQLLPDKFFILGVGRSRFDDASYRAMIQDVFLDSREVPEADAVEKFLQRLHYMPLPSYESFAISLQERLTMLSSTHELSARNYIFYLATPPSLYEAIPEELAKTRLHDESDGWKRIIIEKPFGYDLESALRLNDALKRHWSENQIYRIDHYLGKETVQNVLVTRFSNGIFEPLWNRNFIHHVEISSAENFGVGQRAGYYEKAGALRDMIQNHLLQLVSLIAMEPPASLDAASIRNETVKVLQSLRPLTAKDVPHQAIRGQYMASMVRGEKLKGYREEEGVAPDSHTETFAALKFYIDNWRWGGVPFYIRTGKHLPTRVTEVVIHFKPTPHYLFARQEGCESCNQLIIRIQPDEGILLKFGMKTPGAGFNVKNVSMDFHYRKLSDVRISDAYERLLLDAMTGDATLFARIDAVLAAWSFVQPVLDAWKTDPHIPLYGYPAGTWGPDKADSLIEDGMNWRYPCAALTGDDNFCEL